ncbi:MAG: CocE/NonD family hydrolase [Paludisphaera borealis]|uniref:alpha/beta hydrolase family protein n=1 Tax=Paludisphaera borealis TaxID=1387353 RepID=UPI002842F951|nr:CocE/NonD family hydrolase [Paludisphaera borealis]MDR3619528.1 CocE/NonD family hydrolase [Paludisphaera borealis]
MPSPFNRRSFVQVGIRLATAALAVGMSSASRAGDDAEPPLAAYFRTETARLAAHPLLDVKTAEEWKARRPELQRRLLEMLCLDPAPERTDLRAEVRGVVERPDFVVEKIVFQSSPGLYVTGDLYRPKTVTKPLPAVLYVCGHAKVEKNGVIYGNKAHYQHHGAWFAANGYVCLVVDTLQLGEAPGLHHGTYREGMWWWYSKGYTPAGVEVWNGIRAIDYLVSRPEVDPSRLGVTGRSGGGAMSWYLGAVDDPLKVVVPVAGITDLHDHVVAGNPKVDHPHGVVEGHCDCMYFNNTYRWDHAMVAALVAPKALLVVNTDVDPIFPIAGVRRIFKNVETVYDWYGDRDRLDLLVGKGGHEDTVEIRHPSFAWFERWLKNGKGQALADVKEPDRAIPVEALKVLDPGRPLPTNVNDTVHESFAPPPSVVAPPESPSDWEALKAKWRTMLEEKVFAGWPSEQDGGRVIVHRPYVARSQDGSTEIAKGGLGVTAYDFWSDDHSELKLRIWMFATPGRNAKVVDRELVVLNADGWNRYAGLIAAFESETGDPTAHPEFEAIKRKVEGGALISLLAPRGVGPTAWPKEKDVQIRRRFALLGQTLDGMRVLDVRRASKCVQPSGEGPPLTLVGDGDAAPLALWAAVFEPEVGKVVLSNPPATVRDGPAFLNLDRVLTMPQAVALLYPRAVVIENSAPEPWAWPRALARNLGAASLWPAIEPRSRASR